MNLEPSSIEALASSLREASGRKQAVSRIDPRAFRRLIEHTAEDLTVTVESGMHLAELQAHLATHRQWLPIDPPHSDRITIRDLLDFNLSGPHRFGHGTIREHLLGLRVVLADGRIIRNGGKVVKNVAGFDLCKLFVGAQGSLGAIVEATFKVQPRPEVELLLSATWETLHQATASVEGVLSSPLTPVTLDLYHLVDPPSQWVTVVTLAGTREDVAWQQEKAVQLGIRQLIEPRFEDQFWQPGTPTQTISVAPSRLEETLGALHATEFAARAGNGVIHYRGGPAPPKADLPWSLLKRVKEIYDPANILPQLTV